MAATRRTLPLNSLKSKEKASTLLFFTISFGIIANKQIIGINRMKSLAASLMLLLDDRPLSLFTRGSPVYKYAYRFKRICAVLRIFDGFQHDIGSSYSSPSSLLHLAACRYNINDFYSLGFIYYSIKTRILKKML